LSKMRKEARRATFLRTDDEEGWKKPSRPGYLSELVFAIRLNPI
jgi:hypothetical protein